MENWEIIQLAFDCGGGEQCAPSGGGPTSRWGRRGPVGGGARGPRATYGKNPKNKLTVFVMPLKFLVEPKVGGGG